MKRIALLALLLLNLSTLFAQYTLRKDDDPGISEEEKTSALIGVIVIFTIVFGSAVILYIKQRMDEES